MHNGEKHEIEETFLIFDMNGGNDAIIGLPTIVRKLLDLFVSMLYEANKLCSEIERDVVSNLFVDSSSAVDKGVPVEPWSQPKDEIAQEDLETPLPGCFVDALHHMEKGVVEAELEYKALFSDHVAAEFAKTTEVIHLLETKGLGVFVPQNWDGVKGIVVDIKFKPDMPSSMKPASRPIASKLFDTARVELNRLLQYHLRPSNSPVASPIVVAPKATAPFIRICGDYIKVNKFVVCDHYPTPIVLHELNKIMGFKVFVDLDMVNAYHQFRLSDHTSQMLSMQTPFGQFEPVFMPEGVSPASHVLQKAVTEIFGDFSAWTVVIFDNILILANDFQDAYMKMERVLDRCIERNIFLKFSKSWLGFDSAVYFGYLVRHNRYELTPERKKAITEIPFPTTPKGMSSFLGKALYFRQFVPHFSSLTASLHDMTKEGFVWDQSTWTHDYKKDFAVLLESLANSFAIFYPDFTLAWFLRTDASKFGVGAVLLQQRVMPDGTSVMEPIGFASHKFSGAAQRWCTFEQEGFGIYFGVKAYDYFLRCKRFILETDHNNLRWIEASVVPKVMRWRIYLQSFDFFIVHISGKNFF